MSRLRLIHNASVRTEADTRRDPLSKLQLAALCAIAFFILKFPMIFITNNPEELRDYDHYVKSSQGEYAYRDYVWIYGPLTPILYGAALKILPHRLWAVRLVSLGLWTLGAAYLSLLFGRYFKDASTIFGATLFASGIFGYPSYSHNHVLTAVAAIAAVFYLLEHLETGSSRSLYLSFAFVLISFFTRPVLMGFGISIGWLILYVANSRDDDKPRRIATFLLLTFTVTALFAAIYGTSLWEAFVPRAWAILESKSYPNLGFLIPHLAFGDPRWVELFAKQLRAAMETALFYTHYFILPTLTLCLASIIPYRSEIRAAMICAVVSWFGSFDILHYGFADPMMEQLMTVRGQYFWALSAAAVFLLLWPQWQRRSLRDPRRWIALGILFATALWSYGPFFIGVHHLNRFKMNQFGFTALQGIYTHPDRSAIFEAASFVNSMCEPTDSVVLPQYDPGIGNLLRCQDLFEKDAYIFTRMPWYLLSSGETPYAPRGGMTNGDAIERRIADFNPRFYITHLSSTYADKCKGSAWKTRDFGTGPNGRRVCWREK